MSKLSKLFNYIILLTVKAYWGFLKGHSSLSSSDLGQYRSLLTKQFGENNQHFETLFSKHMGGGFSTTFASARMGFYALLKQWGVKKGDEVILLGFTCSVMGNAVLRTGAKPTFSDIDANTYGSNIESIKKVVTKNTKVVVAQHTFGIPCDIEPIVRYCNNNNIYVIEDCALSFDSRINGIQVGSFGDAALFSFDHSKPINAVTGGLVYTKIKKVHNNLKTIQSQSGELPKVQKQALYNTMVFESRYFKPNLYGRGKLVYIMAIKFFHSKYDGHLDKDFSEITNHNKYPYPAKMPEFVANLAIQELNRWNTEKEIRKHNLKNFLNSSHEIGVDKYLPTAYFDKKKDIVPLRFIYSHRKAAVIKERLKWKVETSWYWFTSPLIACKDPSVFGYIHNSCDQSEFLGRDIINWPCIYTIEETMELMEIFRSAHFGLPNGQG